MERNITIQDEIFCAGYAVGAASLPQAPRPFTATGHTEMRINSNASYRLNALRNRLLLYTFWLIYSFVLFQIVNCYIQSNEL